MGHIHPVRPCFHDDYLPTFLTLTETAKHIAYTISRCLQDDVVRVEATLPAAFHWFRRILGTVLDYGPYVSKCTPGYLNNEGRAPRNILAGLRSMAYMGSALDWLRYLEDWREEGKLRGLRVARRRVERLAPPR